jgi:uncharacterized protein YjbJ (UPF0337 family)
VGEAMGSNKQQAKGMAKQAEGKMQKAAGDMKESAVKSSSKNR